MNSTVIGALIFLSPLAIVSAFASRRSAVKHPSGVVWTKIVFAASILIICTYGLAIGSHNFDAGDDMLGLSLLLAPIMAIVSLVSAGVVVGSITGLRTRAAGPR